MAEIYINVTLIFTKETKAKKFIKSLTTAMDENTDEYILSLNSISKIQIKVDEDTEYLIEHIERTVNIVKIQLGSGGDVTAEESVPALTALGAETVLFSITSEYEDQAMKSYFHQGSEVTKKKDIKALLTNQKADPLTEFLTAVKNNKIKKAIKLSKAINIDNINISDDDGDAYSCFIYDVRLSDITVSLINRGVFDNNIALLEDLEVAVYQANVDVLKALFSRIEKEDIVERSSAYLWRALGCEAYRDIDIHPEQGSGFELVEWLVPWLVNNGVDLNKPIVLKESPNLIFGSPLWEAYQEQNNLAGIRFMQKIGALSIAPIDLYGDMNVRDKARTAAEHDDLATLKQLNILSDALLLEEVIYLAALNKCFQVISWLTEQGIDIDWAKKINIDWEEMKNFSASDYLQGRPLYSIITDSGRYDDEFANYVLEAVAKLNVAKDLTMLVCIFVATESSVELLNRAFQLGANLSLVVKYDEKYYSENDDDKPNSDMYPLREAVVSQKLENLEALLKLGATVPSGEIYVSGYSPAGLVDYIKSEYLATERKKALKMLNQYGLS